MLCENGLVRGRQYGTTQVGPPGTSVPGLHLLPAAGFPGAHPSLSPVAWKFFLHRLQLRHDTPQGEVDVPWLKVQAQLRLPAVL